MKTVKILKLITGATCRHEAGTVTVLDDEFASALVEAGAAQFVEVKRAEVITAEIEPEETTEAPHVHRRRGRPRKDNIT